MDDIDVDERARRSRRYHRCDTSRGVIGGLRVDQSRLDNVLVCVYCFNPE